MNILGNISLGLVALIYCLPLQLCLSENKRPTGDAAMGLITYFFLTIPMGFLLFLALCAVLTQGGFTWLGGGRGWQLLILTVTALAFTAVISIAAVMRGDPGIPLSMRPLMPWGIYALPLLAILGTAALNNPALANHVPASLTRSFLIICGSIVLLSSTGMIVEWIVQEQKNAARKNQAAAEFSERNIQRIVSEVEGLDPIKDLGRLFQHAGINRYEEPRELARKKILTHPNLQQEIIRRLGNEWVQETLEYLAANDAPDPAALAEPIRMALAGMTAWIKIDAECLDRPYPQFKGAEVRIALGVAEKYSRHGVDYTPEIRDLRAAFDQPSLRGTTLNAPAILDAWFEQRYATTR